MTNQSTAKDYVWPPLNLPRLPKREEMDQVIDCLGLDDTIAEQPASLIINYAVVFDLDEFGHKWLILLTDNDMKGFPESTLIVEGCGDQWRLLGTGRNTRTQK